MYIIQEGTIGVFEPFSNNEFQFKKIQKYSDENFLMIEDLQNKKLFYCSNDLNNQEDIYKENSCIRESLKYSKENN